MSQKAISFCELQEQVLGQLRAQRYMDSTLEIYLRTYNRIHVFLNLNGADVYTHEFGKKFLDSVDVCKSTLSGYKCAVRRLDDYIDNKPYRCHLAVYNEKAPEVFSDILDDFLCECAKIGNSRYTIAAKKHTCIQFLNYLEKVGCSSLKMLDSGLVSQALLVFSNKDHYARVRMFLHYLGDMGIAKKDFSGIVPRHKRPVPIPSTYTPDEIARVEKAIDTAAETGRRALAIIRLASRMGLRSGDIAGLKLSDIDFVAGTISILQEKTGQPLTLEMPDAVSKALSFYLKNKSAVPEDGYVFHSMTAPYNHITTSIIRHTVNNSFLASGVDTSGKKHGPHAFRSSLASSMVNGGSSYEVTRRILGHSDPNVIKRYAKVDIKNLRLCSIDPPAPAGLFGDYLSRKKVIRHV